MPDGGPDSRASGSPAGLARRLGPQPSCQRATAAALAAFSARLRPKRHRAGLLRMPDVASALSPVLTAATVRAATRVAAGESLGRAVSASVAAIVNESLRTQMLVKLITAGAAIAVLGGVAIGAVAFGFQVTQRERAASPSRLTAKAGPVQAKPCAGPKNGGAPTGRKSERPAISPDGKTLAASCTYGSVRLLDAQTGETRITLTGLDKGVVREIAFTPDGKTLIGVTAKNSIGSWDVSTGDLRKITGAGDMSLSGSPPITTNTLAISPDGGLIAVGGGGSATPGMINHQQPSSFFEIRILSATSGSLMWSHLGRSGYVVQLAFSPDGKTLASATYGEIRLWDAGKGDLTQTLKPESGDRVRRVRVSQNNKLVAGYGMARVGDERKSILTLWDATSAAILQSIEAGPWSASIAPGTLAFSPDGKSVATAGVETRAGPSTIGGKSIGNGEKVINHIKLWDVATGGLVWTSAGDDQGQVNALLFSPDGNSLFCCDLSATTRIDARTGQVRQDLLQATEPAAR